MPDPGVSAEITAPHGRRSGTTLARRKKYDTVGSSGPWALAMDEIQYGFGDGPCLSAIREAQTELVSDVTAESRWPEYMAAVFEHGVRSILAVPFKLDQEDAKAALNLYALNERAFSAGTIDAAESYVHIASGSLQLAVRIARLSDARQDLMAAMESRTAIDTAVGAVMAQNRCSQEAAFAMLKRASSSRNVKLRDIAASIVASVARARPSRRTSTPDSGVWFADVPEGGSRLLNDGFVPPAPP